MPTVVAPKLYLWTREELEFPPSEAALAPGKSEFILHYTTGQELGHSDHAEWWRAIYRHHTEVRGFDDIGYSFGFHNDPAGDPLAGHILEGRGFDRVGAHAKGHNTVSIGAVFLGNDDPETNDATPGALRACRWILDEGVRLKGPLTTYGHRDVGKTVCPGGELWTWKNGGMPVMSPERPTFTGGVRVAYGEVNGIDVIVTGAGPGGGPHAKILKASTLEELASWMAYGDFGGGVFVAVDNDGRVITGADAGGGPHVKVWEVATDWSVREVRGAMVY